MSTSIKRIFRSETGFTLVELLVVIAVLGILAGIAVPRLTGVQDKAKDAAIASIAGGIRTAMGIYHVENEKYPDSGADWGTLNTVLDTLELGTMAEHNIASINYESTADTFKLTFESLTTGDGDGDHDPTHTLTEKGFTD
ncbi:MAG: type II secretion system GspH family protein [Halanaerobiales bacterium]|nr:type II secretion system GspH family protein [Halanaerobiales bacterium]